MKIEDAKNFQEYLSKNPKKALSAFDVAVVLYKLKVSETLSDGPSIENISTAIGLTEDMKILKLARNDIVKLAERD